MPSQKITPFLWFDKNQALEAATFYTSLFDDARILSTTPVVVKFSLAGQEFCALNGGPNYKFTPAVSFLISCEDQAEVDRFWEALLSDGGHPQRCGWLVDKFGVSWQVVPKGLPELLNDDDPARAQRTQEAMMQMQKLDIAALQKANAGD